MLPEKGDQTEEQWGGRLVNSRVPTIWPLEPHTRAKHEILVYYLKGWFPILASIPQRMLYIDGFAGPGEYTGGEDGSPILAIKTALEHRLKDKFLRPGAKLVFIFVDNDEARCQNLERKLNGLSLPANFTVKIYCNTFEEVFDAILTSIEEQNKRLAPSFVFIDPFGPTGFLMSDLHRLAQQPSSEVLINFQYQSINQWFLQDPSKHGHLTKLYGDERWRPALDIPDPREKETFLREKYKEALTGLGWKTVRLFRMINKHNQTQCYLFFATSNWRGSLLMKQAMWSAAPEGDFEYSDLTDPYPKLFLMPNDEEYSTQLANRLYQVHRGQTISKESMLQDDVAWDDVCVERHLTRALRILEYERTPPQIIAVQAPSGKRRQRMYPEMGRITFGP
jgi:three-Cys-motif partner protein